MLLPKPFHFRFYNAILIPGLFLFVLICLPCISYAQVKVIHSTEHPKGTFPVVMNGQSATIHYDNKENTLIKKSAEFLAGDIEKITGVKPGISTTGKPGREDVIIVATVGNNPLIEQLTTEKKLDVGPLKGQWEKFIIQTIDNPFPGIDQALVIVGSDRRGAAYGVFTLTAAMGVSPWHWWADVPVQKKDEIYLEKVQFVSEPPSVKYRGIFINDEAPALRGWATEKFGGFNHQFYEKVYELLLRSKANYLWPAMWQPSAFADDDPDNARLADEYGIVISTSHHEPMMRAHDEWNRYGEGPWNYEENKDKLREFWRGGIERMGDYESVVTMGMRGDGDEAMSEETTVDLLKRIITDQRSIIADVTQEPAEETPQVWAVYKEVQDYYDRGMRVDDDITILFCDDNWGNLRILPKKADLDHEGGYGLYYHFDYVGGPVSYRWLNVTQIERVWEQMNLAYQYGVRELWLVNVGDIKPMELPISFFLDYAWNPDAIQASDLPDYYIDWATQQFGGHYASDIAELLALYTKYNARRTPEMLKPDTYSLDFYREADRVVEEYNQLLQKSEKVYQQLPESYQSAFYQLVHSPIEMCSNLYSMYVAAGKNSRYARQGRASTNLYAEKVKKLFDKDAELTRWYHEELEDGKWNHMMSQTRIGYSSWNNPPANIMPPVSYVQEDVEKDAKPARGWVSIEGASPFSRSFSAFDPINKQDYYIEIFNQGSSPLEYSIETQNDWIKLSKSSGSVEYDEKVYVSIDWDKAPKENTSGEITVKGIGNRFSIKVPIRNELPKVVGFVENNGVVSMDAANYTRKVDTKDRHWTVVPNLGRTGSSIIAQPVNVEGETDLDKAPRLEYDFTVFEASELKVQVYLSPTQDFKKQGGLKFAIAIDDEDPQIINMNEGEITPDYEYPSWWNNSVADHIKIRNSEHKVDKPGPHRLKIWIIDPGIVFQKIVIDAGGLKPSYLGPPESTYIKP